MTWPDELLPWTIKAPVGLLYHVDRVVHEARRLARIHHADEGLAALAAQAHDVARHLPDERLVALAAEHGVTVRPVDRAEPVLLHGPVGAALLERRYGISRPEVLAAAASHTTGRPRMSLIERIVFVADKIEPEKVARRPELAEVRQAAEHDLDEAILSYLTLEQVRAAERGWPLHPRAVATRNAILLRTGRARRARPPDQPFGE